MSFGSGLTTSLQQLNNLKQDLFSPGSIILIARQLGWPRAILPAAGLGLLFFCVFMLGALCCGFFQCMFYRKDHQLKLLGSRSFCDQCGRTLKLPDFVSFLNYLALRGRCRYCRTPLPVKYFYAELACGLLLLLLVSARASILFTLPWAVFLIFVQARMLYFNRLPWGYVLIQLAFTGLYFFAAGLQPGASLISLALALIPGLLYHHLLDREFSYPALLFIGFLAAGLRPLGVALVIPVLLSAAALRADRKQSVRKYLAANGLQSGALLFTILNLILCGWFALIAL